MIDKVVLSVEISVNTTFADLAERLEDLAERNKLQKWNNGETVYYESTDEAKLTGLYLQTKGGRLQIKCSLHKQYSLRTLGSLDNSGQFTMRNAVWIKNKLFEEIGLDPKGGFVTYYEIGLNIPTDRPPVEYLQLVKTIGGDQVKPVFIDANYKIVRQITTEKSRTIKKFFKMYDKGFEMSDRKRQPHDTDPNILRIETAYKRQKINIEDFFTVAHLNKIAALFIKDWRGVEFKRQIQAPKGTNAIQEARAQLIFEIGIDGFKRLIYDQRQKGELSERKYRTAREFARDWDKIKGGFSLIPSKLENEYREKLEALFQTMATNDGFVIKGQKIGN